MTSSMVHTSPTAAPVRSHVRGRSRPQPCIQAFLWNPGIKSYVHGWITQTAMLSFYLRLDGDLKVNGKMIDGVSFTLVILKAP